MSDSPDVWEQQYAMSPEVIKDDDLIRDIANHFAQGHAKALDVPVAHMHAWWGTDDYRDPLSRDLVLGWRSDWGEDCKKKCRLHE